MTADAPSPTIATSLKGNLIIAMPMLEDPNFRRMVTLMISHDESGAFGIVLGPATNLRVKEVGTPLGIEWQRQNIEHVRYGGPCEPPRIWLVHGGETAFTDAVTIAPGVHLGSSPALLRALNDDPSVPAMLFSGYAGWAPGQLERELQYKSWLPGEVTPDLVFATDPDAVWAEALKLLELSPGFITSGRGASA